MASILGGYLRAREGSYFKQEQEADLHKHRKKLEKEGKLPIVDPKVKEKSFSESEELFEVSKFACSDDQLASNLMI